MRIEPVNLATLLQSLLSRFLSSGKNASPCVAVVLHVIEPTEARIVAYIYESCLEGATPAEIAAALTEQGIKSPMGNDLWSASTVRSILRNEKYCGDALMQKTYIKDFRTHKSVKNTDLNMYFKENHHTAIIKKEDWIKVQKLLSERHSTAKRATLRRLSNHFVAYRVKDGLFKGYLIMDSRWSFMDRQEFIKNVDEAQNTLK
nr:MULTISPECIES: recombinase family protein [unclassified Butyricicoccus]